MVNEAKRRSEQLLLADEDLMSFVPHGDKEALGTLYDRHSRTAYSLAYRMMGTVRQQRILCRKRSSKCGEQRKAIG